MILDPDRFDAITALRPGSEWYSTADGVLHWVSEDTTAPTEDEIARQEGWFVDQYNEALDEASEKGKPLFIDFTGVYCANCRVMERRVFPQDEVKEQLDKMVLASLYVDKKDSLSEVYAKMQFERYNQATQPYYVILDPKDESTLADTGGYIPNGFSSFLEKGNNKFYN